jgi:hypothetical protein
MWLARQKVKTQQGILIDGSGNSLACYRQEQGIICRQDIADRTGCGNPSRWRCSTQLRGSLQVSF